jgi:hypothetical protein
MQVGSASDGYPRNPLGSRITPAISIPITTNVATAAKTGVPINIVKHDTHRAD